MIRYSTLFILGLAFAVGCKDDGKKDEVEIVPFKSTRILTADDLDLLEAAEEDGTLRFSSVPRALQGVARGQVLVSGQSAKTPSGLLRIVNTVSADGRTLETLHAPIQLAFQKVHIKAQTRSTGELGATAWPSSDVQPLTAAGFEEHVGKSQDVNVVLFDGDGDTATTNDQIVLEGVLGGAIDYGFSLDFDWGALEELPQAVADCVGGLLEGQLSCSLTDLLPEAKAIFAAQPSLSTHLEVHGAAILSFEKEFTLYESNVGELVYPPIVITPHVKIVAKVEGEAQASFATSVDSAIAFETSVTLSSKHPTTPDFKPPELKDVSLEAEPPRVTLTASAKAGLGAELSTLIYGVSGPFVTARAFGELDADVFRDPCVTLSAGLEGSLGVKITTPAFLFLEPFDLVRWETALGPIEQALDVPVPACEPPPNASTLPPGAGPDAEHLANPTFTPWSRTFGSPLDSVATVMGGNTYWLDQLRTIDDRFVVTTRGASALTKFAPEGDLVWTRQYSAQEDTLEPSRIHSTRDAGILVLAEADVPPHSIIKITQFGRVEWRRELSLGDASCTDFPIGVTSDGGSGFQVVMGCSANRVVLVHLDAAGNVLDAQSIGDSQATELFPSVIADAAGELFIAGRVRRPADAMFAIRRNRAGAISFTKRYATCAEGMDAYPVRALIESNGDVTVAGRGGAEHNGFVARLKVDGSVGFASFPGFGFGLGSVYVLDAIAQLPTTGYVVSGAAVRLSEDPPAGAPGLALALLDSVGQPLWARRYVIEDSNGDFAPIGHTDLDLTDDGGIVVSAAALLTPGSTTADIWSLKVAAKDGLIDLAPNGQSFADPITALPCTLTPADWDVTVQSVSGVTTRVVP